jgi:hypothetical protein
MLDAHSVLSLIIAQESQAIVSDLAQVFGLDRVKLPRRMLRVLIVSTHGIMPLEGNNTRDGCGVTRGQVRRMHTMPRNTEK